MGFDLNNWYNEKRQGDIILEYAGSISTDVISNTLAEFESKISTSEDLKRVRKKVYNVLVECLQNLYHHVDEPPENVELDEKDKYGALILTRDGTFFRISTGNFIKKDKINSINQPR